MDLRIFDFEVRPWAGVPLLHMDFQARPYLFALGLEISARFPLTPDLTSEPLDQESKPKKDFEWRLAVSYLASLAPFSQ